MKIYCIFLVSILTLSASAQEKIFAFGYAKNFVNKDSSNFSIQIDFNRIPGKTENPGTVYILNTALGKSQFGLYIKPTADVNLGSYTTIAPNNISLGLPVGLAYDFTKSSPAVISASLELIPEMVSDKSLQQYLYYLTKAVVLNYSFVPNPSNKVIDIATGFYLANGTRMVDAKAKTKNAYGRFSIPLFLAASLAKDKSKTFFHLKLTGTYKYNNVFRDNSSTIPDSTLNYLLLKLEYYFIKNLGINISYNYGYEEPLFKKVNSLSFGIALAR